MLEASLHHLLTSSASFDRAIFACAVQKPAFSNATYSGLSTHPYSTCHTWSVLCMRMASETKRHNAGPKVPVALPKPTSAADSTPSSQMVPQEAALHAAVGSR